MTGGRVMLGGPDGDWQDVGWATGVPLGGEVTANPDDGPDEERVYATTFQKPMMFSIPTSVDRDALGKWFGTDPQEPPKAPPGPPLVSLVVEHTDTITTGPPRPARVRGWRARLTWTNARRRREWRTRRDAWVAAGRPPLETRNRIVIPRAQIVHQRDAGRALRAEATARVASSFGIPEHLLRSEVSQTDD